MNGDMKKMDKALAWAAFLASYLLVWLMISMPMERQPHEVTESRAVVASLGVEN